MRKAGWMIAAMTVGGWQGFANIRGAPTSEKDEQAAEAPLVIPVFEDGAQAAADSVTEWTTAVTPKPFTNTVTKGVAWIVQAQNDDGGWGQGEISREHIRGGEPGETSNVADTCAAALVLVRSGACPSGTYAGNVRRAAAFVCGKIEASDEESLYVTDVRGTRLQSKIGAYVDTFLASLFLSEIKGCLEDEALEGRVTQALAKVLDKMERHQQKDGGFQNQGWAPVLAQSIGAKGANRAAQKGMEVSDDFLRDNDAFFGKASNAPAAGGAGVSLYSYAAGLGALQDSVNTGRAQESKLRELAKSDDAEEREEAQERLESIENSRERHASVQGEVVDRLGDEQFVAGFGSNGGEEFLSYMNISESLVINADDVWRRWDAAMADNLGRVQNEDGSWSGHHCITGRTFCTSAALLTLMADRTPVPVEVAALDR